MKIRVWTLGNIERGIIPTSQALDKLASLLRDEVTDIVWSDDIKVEVVDGDVELIHVTDDLYRKIEKKTERDKLVDVVHNDLKRQYLVQHSRFHLLTSVINVFFDHSVMLRDGIFGYCISGTDCRCTYFVDDYPDVRLGDLVDVAGLVTDKFRSDKGAK